MRRGLVVASLIVLAGALASSAPAALRLAGVAGGFSEPSHIASNPQEPNRLYVVEQPGVIRVVQRGRIRFAPFLDIRDRVLSDDLEQGLFSLAFHPRYPSVRRIYVNFTNRAGDTRVVEFRVNAARTEAIRSRSRVLLAVDQPYVNHNGGQIAFGPDGLLYVGMGDGGSGGDPENRAQNMSTRLGKLLSLNVRTRRVKIVAAGLRNPWRFAWDPPTGRVYLGDVGQGAFEEIDVFRPAAPGIENLGWRRFEARYLYDGSTALAQGTRLVMPVYEYVHDYTQGINGASSVTGGFVYRGRRVPSARGRYFFGDFCTGQVWSFVMRNGRREDLREHPRLRVPGRRALSSFGVGPTGELYLASRTDGRIYRIARR